MMLRDLFPNCEGGDTEIIGLTADSRKVELGYLFAALKGTVTDGRNYVPHAIEAGAAAILSGGGVETGDTVHVIADEPRHALAVAAQRFYKTQPQTMVAITGTNGKSSTVDFLRQIWTSSGRAAASMGTLGAIGPKGNINVGHTTPDPVTIHETLVTLCEQGVTHGAMEASSHGLAQFRLDGVTLSAVAFTNFTQDHLDYHETMDEYRDAKLGLFRRLAPKGCPAIVNADDPNSDVFEAAAMAAGLSVVSIGWKGETLKIRELMPRATGQRMFLTWQGQEFEAELPLIGEFQALNALCAAGLALSLGDSISDVVSGLEGLQPVKGRLEFVGETETGAGVFVDYAHTPAGLDVLLRAARPHTAGKLYVIFGCGGDRDAGKRPLMGEIAARHADIVVVTDDNPRSEDPMGIRAQIMAATPGAIEIGDRGEAIHQTVAKLQAGDTLLIAGKGHETGQIVGDKVIPFSDQETAQKAIEGVAA